MTLDTHDAIDPQQMRHSGDRDTCARCCPQLPFDVIPPPVKYSDWLAEVRYRPGWQLWLEYAGPGLAPMGPDILLQIRGQVVDSTAPGRLTEIHMQVLVPSYLKTRDEFLHWLAGALRDLEAHESAEWLQWRESGRPVFDPHGSS